MKRQNSGLSNYSQVQCENTYYPFYKLGNENSSNFKDLNRNKSFEKRSSSDFANMSNSNVMSTSILQQQNMNVKSTTKLQSKQSFSNLSTCNLPLSQQNTARNRSDSSRNYQVNKESIISMDLNHDQKYNFENIPPMKQSVVYQQHFQQQLQNTNAQIQGNINNTNNTSNQRGSILSIVSSTTDSSNNYLKKLEQFKQEQMERYNSHGQIQAQQNNSNNNHYNPLMNKNIKEKSVERNGSFVLGQQSNAFPQKFISRDSSSTINNNGKYKNEENYVGLDNQILIKNYTFDEIENVIKELNCKCGYRTDIREVLIKFGEKFQDLRKKRDMMKEKNKKLKDELNEQFKDKKLLEMQVNYEGFISQVNQKLEEKERQLQRIQTEIKLKESELKLRQDEVQAIKNEKNRISQNNTYATLMPQQICNDCESLRIQMKEESDSQFNKMSELNDQLNKQNIKIKHLEEELLNAQRFSKDVSDRNKNDYDKLLQEKNENKQLREQIAQLNITIEDNKVLFERERSSLTMKIQEVEAQRAIVSSDERLLKDRERLLQEKENQLMEQIQQINYQKLSVEREKDKFDVEKNNFYNEAQKLEDEIKKKEDNIQMKYYVTNQNNNLQNTSSKKINQSQYLNNANLLASPSINNNNNFNATSNLNQNNHHLNSAQSNNLSMNSMKFLFNCSGMEVDDEEIELKMIALKMNEEMVSKKIELQLQDMIRQKEKLDKKEKELKRLENRLNGPIENPNHNSSTHSAMNTSGFHRSSKKKL